MLAFCDGFHFRQVVDLTCGNKTKMNEMLYSNCNTRFYSSSGRTINNFKLCFCIKNILNVFAQSLANYLAAYDKR